jgi:uroporphyrin-III C-methyltransferase / precorrin-2 dehydrogenase / sirohydrochlorin ferrochelatase
MKHAPSAKPRSDNLRIGDLSVLPVFLDLHGKTVCIIGSSEGAVWKAELLRSAGARIKIISEMPSPAVLQFVSGVSDERMCEYAIKLWSPDDFENVFAVVADVGDAEAEALRIAVKIHTSLINIVDKPAFCTFQFGSIVNRSPLVIGISTGGAAPVLAQNVRSRIESVMPQTVQAFAARAARIRRRVNDRLKDASAQRAYWQAFFSRCFGGAKQPWGSVGSQVKVHDIQIKSVADLKLSDIRQLQMADRIEYQSNVDPQILEFARREAIRVRIGVSSPDARSEHQHKRIVRIISRS